MAVGGWEGRAAREVVKCMGWYLVDRLIDLVVNTDFLHYKVTIKEVPIILSIMFSKFI